MSMKLSKSLLRAVLLASLALPASALVPAAMPFAAAQAHAGILAEHKAVLAQYGTFEQHPRYGEVWVPSVTPQGWHPYQPCHWIYTKYGWYFDDKTEWGKIVHHFGRWTHEAGSGWIWVPGEQFSPGWVVWKANEQWVGWAPMPPDQDVKTLDAQSFNSDKMWIFMETEKFGKSCDGGVAPVAQIPTLLTETKYIRDVVFVDGVAVFVFPVWLVGPIIDIDIDIVVWSPTFIIDIVTFWNVIWNITVNVNLVCLPQIQPDVLHSMPPKPPGRRSEVPPSFNPNPPRQGGDPQKPGDPRKPNVIVDWLPPNGIRPDPNSGGKPESGGGGRIGGHVNIPSDRGIIDKIRNGSHLPIDPKPGRGAATVGSGGNGGLSINRSVLQLPQGGHGRASGKVR